MDDGNENLRVFCGDEAIGSGPALLQTNAMVLLAISASG